MGGFQAKGGAVFESARTGHTPVPVQMAANRGCRGLDCNSRAKTFGRTCGKRRRTPMPRTVRGLLPVRPGVRLTRAHDRREKMALLAVASGAAGAVALNLVH